MPADREEKQETLAGAKGSVDEKPQQLSLMPERRYWVHRVDAQFLRPIAMRKVIGSRSARGRKVKELGKGDGVIIATTLRVPREGLPPTRRIAFVAAATVEGTEEMRRPLVGYDKHKIKHRLRGLSFFAEPVWLEEAAQRGLSLLSGRRKLSDAMDFEYREIPESDFRKLVDGVELVRGFPGYLESAGPRGELSFSDHQLVEMFRATREMLRAAMPRQQQVEIKLFLRALAGFLEGAGLEGNYEGLYQEYRRLAHKTGFKHGPSRDPELQVELLDRHGRVHRLAYIRLK